MTHFHAIHVPVDRHEPTKLVTINNFTVSQQYVEGTFDVVRGYIQNENGNEIEISIFVNDEGLIWGMPRNGRLTGIAARELAGPGLIAGGVDAEGNTLSAPEWYQAVIDHTNKTYLEWSKS